MKAIPLRVACPNGCVTYTMSSGPDEYHILDPIFGKDPKKRLSEIMVIKCRKCKFEAWASKELRDKFGKPGQPYYDPETASINSKSLRVEEK